MKALYLDCFAGISGDMFLGALIDLGVSPGELANRLAGLRLKGYRLSAEKMLKNGISGTKVTVHLLDPKQERRHLSDILRIIDESALPGAVKQQSAVVFNHLASAEAKIHGVLPEQVHFHEVGALDAILDIVGTVTALDMLGIEQVYCSPLPLGTGTVECAHGVLPLPAPAVLELLKGLPTRSCDVEGETVTPTGAALVKTLAAGFGPMPSMKIISTGYGAGEAERRLPNMLRVIMGEVADECRPPDALGRFEEDHLNVIEANIDDMNPEFYDYIMPPLFSAGAVEVFLTPVIMKKGRPGQVMTCLVPDHNMNDVINILLSETTTLGVRAYRCHRYKLARETMTVQTPYGPVRVKLGRHPGTGMLMNIAPEWEDCKALAANHNVPVKTVYDLAKTEVYRK